MSTEGEPQSRPVVTLKEVNVVGTVKQSLAEVSVSHIYLNTGKEAVDVTYKLPVSEEELGIFHGYEVTVDDKVIQSEIKETTEACRLFEKYTQRKGDYNSAKPIVLLCDIVSLEPEQKVVLKIKYLYELPSEDKIVKFILPTTTFQNGPPSCALSLSLDLQMQSNISSIHSERDVKTNIDGSNAKVEFFVSATPSNLMREDFLFTIETEKPEEPVWVEKAIIDEKESYSARLRFIPNFQYKHEPRSEFVFLVDTSASKDAGALAIAVIEKFFNELSESSRFKIFLYGKSSDTESSFHPTMEANQENKSAAIEFLKKIEFSENSEVSSIVDELHHVFNQPLPQSHARQVIILSSGRINDLDQAVSIIKENSNEHTRVFAVGLGADCTHYMLNTLTKAGRGRAEFIYNEREINEKIGKHVKRVKQPPFGNVEISSSLFAEKLQLLEENLFVGDPFTVYSKLNGLPTENPASVSLMAKDGKDLTFFAVLQIKPDITVSDTTIVHQLAAKAKIRHLIQNPSAEKEITELALAHELLSPYTSFLGSGLDRRVALLCGDSKRMQSLSPQSTEDDDSEEEEEEELEEEPKQTASTKKVFDKDFLLQFQNMFKERPTGLNDSAIQLLQPNEPSNKGGRGGGGKGGRGGRGGGRGGGGGKKPPREPQPQLELHNRAENRWTRPSRAVNDEEGRKQLVLHKATGILNKITLSTFNSLFEQFINIGINTVEILEGVIGLLFEKSLLEPTFSSMYADFCVELQKKLPTFEQGSEKINFRRLLLKKCQEEFESAVASEQEDIDTSLPESVREELAFKARKKMLGNIKFIGELFKRKMLTEPIMITCINHLLKATPPALPDDDNIEALCKLLTTIGKLLDQSKEAHKVEIYYKYLASLSQNKELGSRYRFMIQDVLDLRKMNWVPRRAQDEAKTIDQVHQEAKLEDMKAEKQSRQILNSMRRSADTVATEGGRRGGRDGPSPRAQKSELRVSSPATPIPAPAPAPAASAGGWVSVASGGGRSKPRREEPQQRGKAKGGWRSSSEGAKGKGGAFEALNESGSRGGKTRGSRGGRGGARGGDREQRDAQAKSQAKQKEVEEKDVQQSEEAEEEADPQKLRAIVEEYLSSYDTSEAVLCVQELPSSYYAPFVKCSIMETIEKKEKERELIVKLFAKLTQDQVLTQQNFELGFDQVVADLDDIEVDIPLAPKLVAQFLAEAMLCKSISLSYLNEGLKPLVEVQKALKVVLETIVAILDKTKSEDETTNLIKESKLNLASLTSKTPDEIKTFVNDRYKTIASIVEKSL